MDEFIKVKIESIRKHPHENWNHYNFENYNSCPFCNGGKLQLTGQFSEYQNFVCLHCYQEFTLNTITEEIENRYNIDAMSTLTKYVNDFGIPEITNKYGETIKSTNHFIVFSNNYIACIGKIYSIKGAKYAVGACEVDDFRWRHSEFYKTMWKSTYCTSEADILEACEKIRNLPVV